MTRRRYITKQTVSAGGVVYRRPIALIAVDPPAGDPLAADPVAAERLEVLLLQTPSGVWGLPKGTPDAGETLAQTACREVREETGLEVQIGEKIGVIEYWFARPQTRERLHKFVHFWLMQPTGGSLDDHDHEHVSVRWFPLPAALRRVTHDNSADILQQAAGLIGTRPLAANDRPSRESAAGGARPQDNAARPS